MPARRIARHALLKLSSPLLGALLAASSQAQQATQPAQPVATSIAPQDLAKSVHNPFEDFIKVPFQSSTGFDVGLHRDVGESLNIQPVLPFSLNTQWDLIALPSLSVTYVPSPNAQLLIGLEDLQTSFFFTPAGADEWIWGVGPIFQFPTATADQFETGRWSAGPTAALVYSKGPWFNGVLAYQLMSFAGDRDRGSVNQTSIQPQLSYNFESGWYVDTNPTITYDWTADAANAWTIPLGGDIGKAFNLGSQALSLQIGSYDLVKRPVGTPQWIIRLQVTLLFSKRK